MNLPTVRLAERDGKFRAYCNDCNWNYLWMNEVARDVKAGRHINMHRISRGFAPLPVDEGSYMEPMARLEAMR